MISYGSIRILKSLISEDSQDRKIYDLSTNIWKKSIKQDPRGQIIVFPYLKLEAQGYGDYIHCCMSDDHPKELYILDSSATQVVKFLERMKLDIDGGLPIRKDRSIIPKESVYEAITNWPGKEEQGDLLALLKALVIFKSEFSSFNPLNQKVDSHPIGYRRTVRQRVELLLRRSPYLYRGLSLDFRVWLDNLGPEIIKTLLVSRTFIVNYTLLLSFRTGKV